VKVGGFHRMPTRGELAPVAEALRSALDDALATVRWAATLDFPDFEQDYAFVALQRPDEYAVLDGRLASSTGLDVPIDAFSEHITEHHVPHSNALHARLDGDRSYMAGPMARFALNGDRLSPLAREVADEVGLRETTRNPFQSIIVRAVELVHACDEALALIDAHDDTADPSVEVVPRRAVGHGASEAPRGLLYHRYEIDDDGSVLAATIIPPTSQNQAQVEDDLRRFVEPRLDMDQHELTHQCEQAIRNYDPCISCATHFLDLTVVHE
jgi:sulfhydrogenase subunit alpha